MNSIFEVPYTDDPMTIYREASRRIADDPSMNDWRKAGGVIPLASLSDLGEWLAEETQISPHQSLLRIGIISRNQLRRRNHTANAILLARDRRFYTTFRSNPRLRPPGEESEDEVHDHLRQKLDFYCYAFDGLQTDDDGRTIWSRSKARHVP